MTSRLLRWGQQALAAGVRRTAVLEGLEAAGGVLHRAGRCAGPGPDRARVVLEAIVTSGECPDCLDGARPGDVLTGRSRDLVGAVEDVTTVRVLLSEAREALERGSAAGAASALVRACPLPEPSAEVEVEVEEVHQEWARLRREVLERGVRGEVEALLGSALEGEGLVLLRWGKRPGPYGHHGPALVLDQALALVALAFDPGAGGVALMPGWAVGALRRSARVHGEVEVSMLGEEALETALLLAKEGAGLEDAALSALALAS